MKQLFPSEINFLKKWLKNIVKQLSSNEINFFKWQKNCEAIICQWNKLILKNDFKRLWSNYSPMK